MKTTDCLSLPACVRIIITWKTPLETDENILVNTNKSPNRRNIMSGGFKMIIIILFAKLIPLFSCIRKYSMRTHVKHMSTNKCTMSTVNKSNEF